MWAAGGAGTPALPGREPGGSGPPVGKHTLCSQESDEEDRGRRLQTPDCLNEEEAAVFHVDFIVAAQHQLKDTRVCLCHRIHGLLINKFSFILSELYKLSFINISIIFVIIELWRLKHFWVCLMT